MGPGKGHLAHYQQGHVVLVPFPFTNLQGQKRRPALIAFHEAKSSQDLILCAVTSQIPASPGKWDIDLGYDDLEEQRLPKPSIIKVNKLFTLHMGLVVGRYGRLTESKLDEVLERLQTLFRRRAE